MARGILAGIAAGVVVAGLGLGTASLVLGPVEMEPVAPTPGSAEEMPESEVRPDASSAPDDDAGAPEAETDTAEEAGQAPAEPTPETTPQVQAPDSEPAPDAEDAPGVGSAPATTEGAESDAMTVPTAPEAAPEADADAEDSSDPATDTAPEMSSVATATDESATAPAPEAAPEDAAPEPDPRATTGLDLPDGAPEILPPEDVPLPDDSVDPSPEGAPEADVGGDPVPETGLAAPAPQVEDMPQADPVPAEVPEGAPEADPALDNSDTPGPGADAPAPEADAADAGAAPDDPVEEVVTGRLPSIGEAPQAETPSAAPVPALVRNAIDFAGAGDQPLLAILLLDTGGDRTPMGDLGKLPFPVTVAVDAGATDAVEAIAFYRDQGAEIMLDVPLPEGATATDVEVSIEAYGPLLENAAAVMVADDLGFQTLGEGAVQLGVNLAETGHGFVSYPAGLNTGHKAVLKEGVQAGLVFRDLDGAGQEGPVIRRFLDNAAFRARNEERVIVVARTRAETVQALLEWSLGTRAQTVTLVPVSAVLEGG